MNDNIKGFLITTILGTTVTKTRKFQNCYNMDIYAPFLC